MRRKVGCANPVINSLYVRGQAGVCELTDRGGEKLLDAVKMCLKVKQNAFT